MLTYNQATQIIKKYDLDLFAYYNRVGWFYFGMYAYRRAEKLAKEHKTNMSEHSRNSVA